MGTVVTMGPAYPAGTMDDAARRIRLAIDDSHFELRPTTDLADLRERIEAASKTDGQFVDFDVADGGKISALIGAPCSIFISIYPAEARPALEHDAAHPIGEFDL